MKLSSKPLEKLTELINEKTEYRSGPKLVEFFNKLGFNDSYGQGFPSRWFYTDDRLKKLNGTPKLDQCIRNVFAPVNFIERIKDLDEHIIEFNRYLTFDKWKVIRDNEKISFERLEKVEIVESTQDENSENEFLSREFSDIDVEKLGLEGPVTEVLNHRIIEIEKCFAGSAPLGVILLAGSTLEGIFLGLANKYPQQFNSASASPKDSIGEVKQFHNWSLNSFIDVAKELGLVQYDTQQFSHSLRDFRNYIHPYEQMRSGFKPRIQTAKISLQVLKAAIYEVTENIAILTP